MKAPHNIFHAAGFGKVAPWVDLANSEEWDGFGNLTDHLANPRWLATFLKHWNLHPLPSKDVPSRKLVQLRVLLRRAAEKVAAGGSLDPREISKVNQALKVPVRQELVQDQNGIRAETVPVVAEPIGGEPPFNGHLTVARSRGRRLDPSVRAAVAGIPFAATFDVNSFDLVVSERNADGHAYTTLATFPLAG